MLIYRYLDIYYMPSEVYLFLAILFINLQHFFISFNRHSFLLYENRKTIAKCTVTNFLSNQRNEVKFQIKITSLYLRNFTFFTSLKIYIGTDLKCILTISYN